MKGQAWAVTLEGRQGLIEHELDWGGQDVWMGSGHSIVLSITVYTYVRGLLFVVKSLLCFDQNDLSFPTSFFSVLL